jgi:hypothetical protein
MAALRNNSKCSHTTCMLRFFTVSRLTLNPNLIFEIGSNNFIKTVQIYKTESTFFQVTKSLLGDQPIIPLLILNQWVGCYLLMLNHNIIDDAYCDLTGRGIRNAGKAPISRQLQTLLVFLSPLISRVPLPTK